jgi:hypothetical protein
MGAERASDLLRQSLAAGLIGLPHWKVVFRVEHSPSGGLRGQGDIIDDQGARVARRILFGTDHDCTALALGVGLWASLVLDAESKRLRTIGAESMAHGPLTPATAAAESSLPEAGALRSTEQDSPSALTPENEPIVPAPAEMPSREPDWFLRNDDGARTLEVGVSGFLMSGVHGGPMAGPSPYLVAETAHGIFLRPALAFGRTIGTPAPGESRGTWLDSRLDACLRVPGLYSTGGGLQLDLCAGGDLGVTVASGSGTFPYAALGPSLDIRGELGKNMAVTLRGVFGINLVSSADLWSGRIELALSWGLR